MLADTYGKAALQRSWWWQEFAHDAEESESLSADAGGEGGEGDEVVCLSMCPMLLMMSRSGLLRAPLHCI